MKSFLLFICIILVPVFGGIAVTNYIVDPGHIYSEAYIDSVIKGLELGKNVTNVSNLDERIFREKFAKLHQGDSVDYLIMGASRVLTISEDVIPGSVLNMGVSGCKIEDLIAIYEICKHYHIHYNNVILGVDPTLFNSNDKDSRWKTIASYYRRYNKEKGIDFSSPLWDNLFSVSYFKLSLKSLNSISTGSDGVRYSDTYINENGTKRPDGSIYYAKSYRERDQRLIDEETKTWTHSSFRDYTSVSNERKLMFMSLINTIEQGGAGIIFLLCPYHPMFYSKAFKESAIIEGANFIKTYASSKGFLIIGDYNPQNAKVDNTDFYDAVHIKKESLDTLINSCNL